MFDTDALRAPEPARERRLADGIALAGTGITGRSALLANPVRCPGRRGRHRGKCPRRTASSNPRTSISRQARHAGRQSYDRSVVRLQRQGIKWREPQQRPRLEFYAKSLEISFWLD